jgi:DNA-binding NarL/FixJ family response regulator
MTDLDGDTAILATRSSALAVGLAALLLSIPPISRVETVEEIDSLFENLATIHPVLLVVDTPLIGEGMSERLRDIRQLAPDSLRIVLTDDMTEFRELVSGEPDTIFIKGTDPARLAVTLESLLNEHLSG